jgi:exodeoxyribonuclease VII small subunit
MGSGAPEPTVAAEGFDKVLEHLRDVVERLEAGKLSLEESLRVFEEGVRLSRRGAQILDGAERRVEVLLQGEEGAQGAEALGAPKEPTREGPSGIRGIEE